MPEENYEPLLSLLDGYWTRPFSKLPKGVKERVEKEFVPSWRFARTVAARQRIASQLDAQNDPREREEAEFWFDFGEKLRLTEEQIRKLEAAEVNSSSELGVKNELLQELRRERRQLKRIDKSERLNRNDQPFEEMPAQEYVTYLKAKGLLNKKFGATQGEIATWIVFGQRRLRAYKNAGELSPPPRYHFYEVFGSNDYLEVLHRCWFGTEELKVFEPEERYVSGSDLLRRWEKPAEGMARAFIMARIEESRLEDLHPITGITQATEPKHTGLPPLEDALFPLSQILEIERVDLDWVATAATPEVGSKEWRRETGRRGGNAKHSQPGGSRDKRRAIQELWRSGKYTSKDRCAEEECGALGMSFSTARKALRNQPKSTST